MRREVDRKFEISAVTQASLKMGGPALCFERIKGFNIPVVTGLLGTKERCYLALETTREDWPNKLESAIKNPVSCRLVADGACKEVILEGNDIDLNKFPILWHNTKDPGFYLTTTNVISRDPDTQIRNSSVHRCFIVGKNKLAVWINSPMHLRVIARKYLDRDEPVPVAIAIGVDPAVFVASATKVPYGVDELELAGSLKKDPLEVVKCETINLEVPATAELVIEGEFLPGNEDGYIGMSNYVNEGPFGEFTGYYGEKTRSPVLEVKAVTHRDDVVYRGLAMGAPPSENVTINNFVQEALCWSYVKRVCHEEDIRGISLPNSEVGYTVVVSIRKTIVRQGLLVGMAILGSEYARSKKVIVVDDDIDPWNMDEVIWAISTRSRYDDIFPIEGFSGLDPVAKGRLSSKTIIDATLPFQGDKIGKADILIKYGPCKPTQKIDLQDYIDY